MEEGFPAGQIDYNDFAGMKWVWEVLGSVIIVRS
jgi:hypothetical protein